jgi:hypothetical protein
MIWVWRTTVEWYWQGKTEELWEKPVPVPLCPPKIPHGLTRARNRASAVRGRRLTWAMARPNYPLTRFLFGSTTLFPNACHLHCSLDVRDYISRPYKTSYTDWHSVLQKADAVTIFKANIKNLSHLEGQLKTGKRQKIPAVQVVTQNYIPYSGPVRRLVCTPLQAEVNPRSEGPLG